MSPRRSSRARTTGPPLQHTPSFPMPPSSQNRPERSTRSHNKRDTSSAQRSESRDHSATGQADSLAMRRSKRGADIDNEDIVKSAPDDEFEDGADPEAEAEEVTRCVCTFAEYPGPPAAAREAPQRTAKAGIKDEPIAQPVVEPFAEDAGNFFIQCDKCQVWQHGGCVGLMDEAMSPDEYFCEQCKPTLHKIIRGPNGSKSTRYLPVLEATSSRSSSTSSSEAARKKEAKQKAAKEASTRRRATMNSRDAAYDEEEMLRRAIEESKSGGASLKRGRDDESEETPITSKRVRTSSGSPEAKASPSPSEAGSDDEDESRPGTNGLRRGRGAPVRTQKEKDTREKQKEADKAKREEAAGRRAARSERRRVEESPPPTPSLSPSKQEAKVNAVPAKPIQPDTPSSHRPVITTNHRKTGRPPARGNGRGRMRNQYMRDINGDGSPSRDMSRGPASPATINGESGRPSRPKYLNPNRTSLNEMKRRVAGIIEFVSRLQTEQPSSSSEGSASTPNGSGPAGASPASQTNSETTKKFHREMHSTEMMEELMKSAIHWQTTYGKYGEK